MTSAPNVALNVQCTWVCYDPR